MRQRQDCRCIPARKGVGARHGTGWSEMSAKMARDESGAFLLLAQRVDREGRGGLEGFKQVLQRRSGEWPALQQASSSWSQCVKQCLELAALLRDKGDYAARRQCTPRGAAEGIDPNQNHAKRAIEKLCQNTTNAAKTRARLPSVAFSLIPFICRQIASKIRAVLQRLASSPV